MSSILKLTFVREISPDLLQELKVELRSIAELSNIQTSDEDSLGITAEMELHSRGAARKTLRSLLRELQAIIVQRGVSGAYVRLDEVGPLDLAQASPRDLQQLIEDLLAGSASGNRTGGGLPF